MQWFSHLNHLEILLKHSWLDSIPGAPVGPQCTLKICISTQFPSDADSQDHTFRTISLKELGLALLFMSHVTLSMTLNPTKSSIFNMGQQ